MPCSVQLASISTSFLARLFCKTQPSFERLPSVESSLRRARPARRVPPPVEHLLFFKLHPRREIRPPCNVVPSFHAYCRSPPLLSAWFVALYSSINLHMTRNAGQNSEEGFEARGIIGKSLSKGGKGGSVVSGGEPNLFFLQPPLSYVEFY